MALIGLVSPGEMGAVVGGLLVDAGHTVRWSSAGRGPATRARAEAAGLTEADDLASAVADADIVLSICPPDAALDTAREVAGHGFSGLYVDANAIAPATVREVAATLTPTARYVDGGIVGQPPTQADTTRLFLSGDEAPAVAALFDGSNLEAIVLDGEVSASAIKMAYAGWNKGATALALTVWSYAASMGVEDALMHEWSRSQKGVVDRVEGHAPSVGAKAWRWIGEMEEIAASLGEAGLPTGFHEGARDLYDRLRDHKGRESESPHDLLDDLLGGGR